MRIVFCRKNWSGFNILPNKRIILFLLLLAPWLGNAQVSTYHGRVFDSDGQPLEFANVVALSLPDSVFTEGTVTNSAGEFTLSLNGFIDRILFRVSLIGYQTTYSFPIAIDSIVLPNNSIELAEAVVKGGKKAFSMKGNNLECSVAGTSLSSESHVNDLPGKPL